MVIVLALAVGSIVGGVIMMRLGGHRVPPVVIAVALAVGAMAWPAPTDAATNCPSTTTALSPTEAATTTAPFVASVAVDDALTVEVGAAVSGNIFANDTLGDPRPALLVDAIGLGASGGSGLPPWHWALGGSEGYAIAHVTLDIDGSIVVTGLAEGTGFIRYLLSQLEAAEPASEAYVYITVTSPSVSSTAPSTTTPTTTSTTPTTTTTTLSTDSTATATTSTTVAQSA
jgi:hypothetical protein